MSKKITVQNGNITVDAVTGNIILVSPITIGGGQVISSSNNVALLNVENLFSVPQFISLATPQLWLNVNTNPANERAWFVGANAGGLTIGTASDDALTLDYGITIARGTSSPTVTTLELKASTEILASGPTVVNSSLTVTGNVNANGGVVQNAGGVLQVLGVGGTVVQGVHTFTGSGYEQASALPVTYWTETGAAANNKTFAIGGASEEMRFWLVNDAKSSFVPWMVVTRTGNTADSIALTATSITLNGVSAGSFVPTTRTLTAGAGLTGGGDLSADRTFDVGAGTGITVNANDVALDTASTRNTDHASVTLTAGAGLTGGGDITASRTFDVGAGTGITVNANDVAINTSVVPQLSAANVFTNTQQFSSTATSTTVPALRIGDTGATAASAILSAVRAGISPIVLRNTTNSTEATIQASTSTIQIGSNTAHNVEILRNGSTVVTISSTGLSASDIGSGSLNDARLSANVPLLNAANAFTAANTFSTSGANQIVVNTTGTTTADASIQFSRSSTAKGFIGTAGAAGEGITGSAQDDVFIRTQGGAVLFSVNSGSAIHLKIDTSGNFDFKGGTVTTNNASAAEVGYKGLPQNSQSVDYTAVLGDADKNLHQTGASKTFTIPANGSVAYPIGTTLVFTTDNATGVSIAITSDTLRLAGTATTGTRTLAQYGMATALKILSTTWLISGAGLT